MDKMRTKKDMLTRVGRNKQTAREDLRARSTLAAISGCCFGEPYKTGKDSRPKVTRAIRNFREAKNYLEQFAGSLQRFLADAALVATPSLDPERKCARINVYQEMRAISETYPQEPALRTVIKGLEKRFPYLTQPVLTKPLEKSGRKY